MSLRKNYLTWDAGGEVGAVEAGDEFGVFVGHFGENFFEINIMGLIPEPIFRQKSERQLGIGFEN